MDGVDGQEGEVWFLLGMVDEVDLDKLLDFEVRRRDILDNGREQGQCFLAAVHHLEAGVSREGRLEVGREEAAHRDDAPQPVEHLALIAAVQQLLDLGAVERP